MTPTLRKLKLEPTRTFSHRWASWLVVPMAPCDGFLTLGQVEEKSGNVDESMYGVEEINCGFPGGRSFAVRKLGATMGGDDEMYRTDILPRSSQCSCKAGRVRQEICRHRDSLTALIAAGMLPVREMVGA